MLTRTLPLSATRAALVSAREPLAPAAQRVASRTHQATSNGWPPPGSGGASRAGQRCSDRGRRPAGAALASAAAAPAAPPPTQQDAPPKARLAVFVSGGGSNMRAIHAACKDGRINAEIAGGAPGATKEELVAALTQQHRADYVVLAGYLKLIPSELVRSYKRRMLNIHPALLPAFGGKGMYGHRVHEAVVASGARFSGPTVHFVDEEYDTGPILAQRCVPVYPTDSPAQVAARVLQQEHQVYPEAVAALVDQRITWRADGVPILWSAH